jgi:putative hemolysin
MIFDIVLLFCLFLASGYFALAEIAVIAARKARLQQWAEEGNAKAQAALDLANDPSDFLSTVQIGMTLVGILAGAFGGVTIAEHLAAFLATIQPIAAYAGIISSTTVVILITYLTLIIGELVPKRIALSDPERIATAMARQLQWQSRMAGPIVRFLTFSTEIVLKLFRLKHSGELTVTEEEIKVMIDQGTQAGVFEKSEQAIVESVFRFGDLNVSSVMTPRVKIVSFDIDDSLESIQEKVGDTGYSSFPVCQGSQENIVGVVQAKELLSLSLAREHIDLKAIMHPVLFVPENTPAMKVLDLFRKSRPHVAIVVDEYGSIQGLVTLTNILEVIIGDLPSVDEEHDPKSVQREDGTWLISGMMPIQEFKEMFEIGELPGDDEGHYQTVGGFVIMYLGRIPTVADHFELNGLRIEVVDMDGHRVDKILLSGEKSDTAPVRSLD